MNKEGKTVFDHNRERSSEIDQMIMKLFDENGSGAARLALFALGGYGREEMSPRSDIDLLFLHDEDEASEDLALPVRARGVWGEGASLRASRSPHLNTNAVRRTVDSILYPLWNLKFEAGGATRTLLDCRKMFEGDARAQSAMLDARLITGDKEIAQAFFALINEKLHDTKWKKRFIRSKYNEHIRRMEKFGGTIYLLEPHIKEGKGGLREYQTASLIARLSGDPSHRAALAGLVDELSFLFDLRTRLHTVLEKKDDRLTFENQLLAAKEFGLSPDELMSRYYKSAAMIHNKTRVVFDAVAPVLVRLRKKWRESSVKRVIGSMPSWQRLVSNRDIMDSALLFMHKTGELIKLMPVFADIYYKSQYGAYHAYTVDMHSIFSVQKMLELERGKGPKLFRSVFKKIKNKDMLLLAAMLHDIGKGLQDGHHPAIGAEIAGKTAISLGYSKSDADKIAYLIGSHLIMPRLAFSRDMADPRLIDKFSGSVGTVEMLDMLTVLTYADIVSIGPDVWTAWKERLLGELYSATKNHLLGFKADHLHERALRIRKKLDHQAGEFVSAMPDRYFIVNKPGSIISHIEMFYAMQATQKSVITKHIAMPTHSEFAVMTKDAPGIFSQIAGVMAANRINILEAELNTGANGMVLDILKIVSEHGGPVSDAVASLVVRDLDDVLGGRKDVADMIKTGESIVRRSAALDVQTNVVIDNDISAYYTVIDVFARDGIGVLYEITDILFEKGCSINMAKILTKAELVQDSFYVKDFEGKKITSEAKLREIKEAFR